MAGRKKSEIVWESYLDSKGREIYYISSDETRTNYYLYEIQDGGEARRVDKAASPAAFESKFNIREKMRGKA